MSIIEPEPPRAALRILTSSATDEDVAAVTAVLQSALDELASEAAMHDGARPSAWQRSQRPIRGAITPGAGNWRSFG